ncbi:MAG: ADP-ribosylation factor-like protein [Candidatus Helarchaeota archaeon]
MNDSTKYILKQLSSIIDVPKEPKTIKELLNLPVWTLKDVDKGDAFNLDEKLNVKTIANLADVDLKNLPSDLGIDLRKLERWIAAARIAARATKVEAITGKKILVVGLDNAGKSATLEIIRNNPKGSFRRLSKTILGLKPTKGVKRENFHFHNFEFSIWDMGGQKDYRMQYLEKPEYFFVQTDIIYFMLDVQDKERYLEALEYFEKVLSMINYLNETPIIMVLLHKMDPDVSDLITSAIKLEFRQILEKFPDLKYRIFETSIFETSTIFKAFSEGLNMISSHDKIINGIIREFGDQIGVEQIVLIDEFGFEISSHSEDDIAFERLYNLTMISSTFCQTLENTAAIGKLETDKLSFHVLPDDKTFIILRVPILENNYYIGILTDDENKIIETKGFSEKLYPWLENFFL